MFLTVRKINDFNIPAKEIQEKNTKLIYEKKNLLLIIFN